MRNADEIKVILRERDGKKLAIVSVVIFLLVGAIVFFSVYRSSRDNYLKVLDEYLSEIPEVVQSRSDELDMRSDIYEEDVLARSELGMILLAYEDGLDEAKLKLARDAVGADSVSVVDDEGQVLTTTGYVSPEDSFLGSLEKTEPRVPYLDLFPAVGEDGKETGEYDGRGLVELPVPEDEQGRSLIFEYSCEQVLKLYNDVGNWSSVFNRMISGDNVLAFAKTGDMLAHYPDVELTKSEAAQLDDEVNDLFESKGSFRSVGRARPSKLVTLLGERYLASLAHLREADTDIMMMIPLSVVVGNGFYIAASITAIVGCGIVLMQVFVLRCLLRDRSWKKGESILRKRVLKMTWTGIAVVVGVTTVFSTMLYMLEARTSAATAAANRRGSIEYEIDWHKKQEKTIRSTYVDVYQRHAQTLAAFLTDYPEYQTAQGLRQLNDIAGTTYLMLFDDTGHETISSNSYTGFAVGENLSEDYRAVLMGYPLAVVGPEPDPYTGETQLSAAVLMAGEDGRPNGFLLAVYGAANMKEELDSTSLVNVVNNYAVQDGYVAAVIDDETGTFIAHTDPDMVGQKAQDYLPEAEAGRSFEGFTEYDGKSVCISASAADGMTLLFMVPDRLDSFMGPESALAFMGVLLILVLLYYSVVGMLVARSVSEAEAREGQLLPDGEIGPMAAFANGYALFLTVFVIVVLFASYCGWWTSFDYVFSFQWSKGIHLFSLWAVLFVLSATLSFQFLIRAGLQSMEKRVGVRAKTFARLTNSLVFYVTAIFLIFVVADIFGANTTAVLASAGVISIAVGMGAQSMAADLLAGFFMVLEGSVHVGDQVSVGGVKGLVTDMGIRTTEITDEEGNVVILNNSKISGLCNMSRNQPKQEEQAEAEEGEAEDKDQVEDKAKDKDAS